MAVDRARAAQAIEEFLAALGYSLEGELLGTGQRVADAWADDLVSGHGVDASKLLREGALDLGEGEHGAVVLRDISLSTMCPHHLLPSHGKATIGFLPRRLVAGLGSLAAAASTCARRLALQESLGDEIAQTVMDALDARGAFCRLELTHTCFVARGDRQAGSTLETLALRGVFVSELRDLAIASMRGP